jgi:hypothetical protein
MVISNRALQGQPVLPYAQHYILAGSDVFIDLAFLDHTLTGVVPTSLSYQIDDLTNSVNMLPLTNVSPLPTTDLYTLQIPGSIMVMTYPYEGSQVCQISYTMTAIDSVTGNTFTSKKVDVVELCAISTPTGT